MESFIVLFFLASVLVVIIKSYLECRQFSNLFNVIIEKVVWLRGFFFLLFYIYVCLNMMSKVNNMDKWLFLPFVFCGIALIMCMYNKTRKIGSSLFVLIFFGAFFVVMPIMGLISDNNIELSSLIMGFVFIIGGIIALIFILKEIWTR